MPILSFFPITVGEGCILLLVLLVGWTTSLGTWRLYFSPLGQFPGPKLAALTQWYEFYFDCILQGRFAWEIQCMHDVYGELSLDVGAEAVNLTHT